MKYNCACCAALVTTTSPRPEQVSGSAVSALITGYNVDRMTSTVTRLRARRVTRPRVQAYDVTFRESQ